MDTKTIIDNKIKDIEESERIIITDNPYLQYYINTNPKFIQGQDVHPNGIMYSFGKQEYEWLVDNDYKIQPFVYKVRITGCNVLKIENVEEFSKFSKEYLVEISEDIYIINWEKVAEKYDGIEIKKIKYKNYGINNETKWYDYWFADLGYIWNPKCITVNEIKSDTNIDINKYNKKIFKDAVETKNVKMIEFLLNKGIKPDENLLLLAIDYGNTSVIELLINSMNEKDLKKEYDDKTFLDIAIEKNNKIIEDMLETKRILGANFGNIEIKKEYEKTIDIANKQKDKIIDILEKKGVKRNIKLRFYNAIQSCNLKEIKELFSEDIEKKINPNIKIEKVYISGISDYFSALDYVLFNKNECNNIEIAKILIDKGAIPTKLAFNQLILKDNVAEHLDLVESMLNKKSFSIDDHILKYIIINNKLDILKLLFKYNSIKPNTKFLFDDVTYDYDLDKNLELKNNYFISNDSLKRKFEITPLSYAVKKNNINLVKILLENGEDPRIMFLDVKPDDKIIIDYRTKIPGNYSYISPLTYAVKNGYLEIANILLNKGAFIDIYDNESLIYAIEQGNVELVELLLKNGADPFYNTGDKTPRKYLEEITKKYGREIPVNYQKIYNILKVSEKEVKPSFYRRYISPIPRVYTPLRIDSGTKNKSKLFKKSVKKSKRKSKRRSKRKSKRRSKRKSKRRSKRKSKRRSKSKRK